MAENNKKLITQIIKVGEDSEKVEQNLSEFINQFYADTSEGLLKSYENKQLFAVANSAYNFVKNRSAGRKVRVFNPNTEANGYSSERTIIESNLIDSPFILDSITTYLYDAGYSIHEIFHPIMVFERDGKGDIQKVLENGPQGQAESVIHIEITHISSEAELKKIEDGIDNVLDHVQLAVADWPSMQTKAKEVAERLQAAKAVIGQEELEEAVEFVKWASEHNFIFLGYREYDFEKNKNISINKKSELGIFKSKIYADRDEQIQHIPINSDFILKDAKPVEITKSSRRSIVHRPAQMDYIGVKKYDEKGNVIGEERFIGLFTSSVYFQSTKKIPIIRKKIDSVIKNAGFREGSHNLKSLVAVLESHPRDELLQSSDEDLLRIGAGIVALSERPQTKLFIRRDRFLRFFSCIIYIPREFFSTRTREAVQNILEEELNGKVMDYYTQVTDSPLARVHVLLKTVDEGVASDYLLTSNEQQSILSVDEEKLEARIAERTNSWLNSLNEKLQSNFGGITGEALYRDYSRTFPEGYKDLYNSDDALNDINKMEQVYSSHDIAVDFDIKKNDPETDSFQLKLFRLEDKITLSEILPIIENMGLQVIDEVTFNITPRNRDKKMWMHYFKLKLNRNDLTDDFVNSLNVESIKDNFEQALILVWKKKVENDVLNQLIVRASLDYRDVEMVRAYVKYLIQIRFPYSYAFIAGVVSKNAEITKLLVQLFYSYFNPVLEGDRAKQTSETEGKIKAELKKVSSVLEDKVLNQLFHTMQATIRTNYFQKNAEGGHKSYISYKFDSVKVPNIPLPKMFAEIYVYSNDLEGIHLRNGKVARGGLRWSDRHEDFRTEVLGLVKAQHVKNSVIVPVGSKGGFVVKNAVTTSREAYLEQGKECYRNYLRGLLDITDNIVEGKVIGPKDVVARDAEDPYLVVAADKGTASFSDIANGVAAEYNFWLDDAFASGGSVGYDHKGMAITARGAWVSVRRHFAEMGRDPNQQDFTCVGIGDMSGDVFGNGMLLSQNILLVGAFNHLHIYIDPNPKSSAESYVERKRLFELPRSTWADYNAKLISKGGGIFERAAKSIPVSPEMAEVFDITESEIAPDDLIKKLLTSRVDLIWNGGIGTYVKAATETNEQVGDKANDAVRVNGGEIRTKVIGEGGNLGCTQLGRIEYAKTGGRINTDAIDNSAGVDCSDHEVNIKIALSSAVRDKSITIEQRNDTLAKMTDEVAKLVLRDNELQTFALTVAENQKNLIIEDNIHLMEFLEQAGRLNRPLEFLPTNENLKSRIVSKQGLTRPELAVLLSYSKIYVFDDLIASKLPDDPYFSSDLTLYFPTLMRDKFTKEIENHPLRREIITTFVANSIVNRTGTTYFHRMKQETGMKGCDVARAYTVVRDAFGLRELWEAIEKLGTAVEISTTMELYNEVTTLVEKASGWFLRNSPQPLDTTGLVNIYKPAVKEISAHLDDIIIGQVRESRDEKLARYIAANVPEEIAKQVANLEALLSACDITSVSQKTGLPVKIVGQVYFETGLRLNIGWLRNEARNLISDNHWDNLALRSLIDAFYDQQTRITKSVLKDGCKDGACDIAIKDWLKKNDKAIDRMDNFISDLKKNEKITQSMLTIAVQKVNSVLAN